MKQTNNGKAVYLSPASKVFKTDLFTPLCQSPAATSVLGNIPENQFGEL